MAVVVSALFSVLFSVLVMALGCGGANESRVVKPGTSPLASGGERTSCPPATVFVVRHAEKAEPESPDDRNPPLSEAGETRAQAIADYFRTKQLDAVYATNLQRTQQTVEPAASAHALQVTVRPAKDTAGLIDRLKRDHCEEHVLVAGHSNSIPDILRGLGVEERVHIPENQYGDLFIVRFPDVGRAELELTHVGSAR